MNFFKTVLFTLTSILLVKTSYAQEFLDDLYYNDDEVDYTFLYSNSDENLILNDSISYDYTWDEEAIYENRIRKFHNNYHFNYYWDYGWNRPYTGWSLGYHNYG